MRPAGRRRNPPAWPYALILLVWAAGTAAIAAHGLGAVRSLGGLRAAAAAVAWTVAGAAQSIALFYLLGFLAKAGTYLGLRLEPAGPLSGKDRLGHSTVVLYLTAGDFDPEAVGSLLGLRGGGRRRFILHDDGADPKARERMIRYLESHPDGAGWNAEVWHRPERTGGKAGAVNWVLERLDPSWDLLLLCDADSIALDRDALLRAEPEFEEAGVAVVQFRNVGVGSTREPAFHRLLGRAIDVFDVFAAAQAEWGYVPFFGHNAVLRIEEIRRTGGLTPGFFSDDLDLSVRLTLAGRRIVYRRDIRFGERHPADLAAFRKRARKWALGCMQVVRRRLFPLLGARRIPLAHRVGLLEFMGFYPAQALLLAGMLTAHLALPWLAPGGASGAAPAVLAGAAVLAALFAPTLAWAVRNRGLRVWPALAWSCALVYGGSITATARGVVDGLARRDRPWVPTNLSERRAGVPLVALAESSLGFALALIPWYFQSPLLGFPASYLFIAVFLLAPITFAVYRDPEDGRVRSRADAAGAGRLASGALPALLLCLLAAAPRVAAAPAAAAPAPAIASVRGDQLTVGGGVFRVQGIHYSPWPPGTGPDGRSPYPSPDLVDRDLKEIRNLGCNTILIQDAPAWVIDHARARGLYVIYAFNIQWNDTSRAFFDGQAKRIVAAVDSLRDRPGVLAWILGHEVPPWVVTELGAARVEGRLRDLAAEVRVHDPGRLLGHANWPPTKELNLGFLDLACFNLYPAWPYDVAVRGYGPYLREVLLPLAAGRPLLITEFGINSLEAGEPRQAEVLADCWREIRSSGSAGGVVFEWADEWWKNYDNPIPGKGFWERAYAPDDAARHDADPEEYYGIVRADRTAKPARAAVERMWAGPGVPLDRGWYPWTVLLALAAGTGVLFGLLRRRRERAGAPPSRRVACLLLLFLPGSLPGTARAAAQISFWDVGDTLRGEAANDQFGWGLAGAGDLDGDHFGDLAIGARFHMVGGDTAAGSVYVYRGGQPPGTPWLVRLDGLSSNEHFGESQAGGNHDIDGDGLADLAVGAPLRSTLGFSANGSVDLFRGGPGFGSTRWATLSGEASDDWFGQSVALGDLDGDGKAEIIVGAPYNDRGGSAAGAVFIYKGSSTPPATPWKILVGEAANDQFGWSVAYAGDVNGDGYGDVVVGARLHGTGLLSAAGKVYVFYGGPAMDSVADLTWVGEAKDDWFGNSVAGPGDVDGGGRADILVGAPYNDRVASAAGAAYLFRGEDPPGSAPAAIYVGESANAQFGWTVAGAGDVDGDGHPDLVVGARLQASGAFSAAGRIYVFPGGSPLSSTAMATADGDSANDWFGNAVSDGIGYFYPGRGAPLAGAPYNDAVASAAGSADVLGHGARLTAVAGEPSWPIPSEVPRVTPNPASDPVVFRWRAAPREPVRFEVFDVSGRLVRSVQADAASDGTLEAAWDLRNRAGQRVASGVYFVAAVPRDPREKSQARPFVVAR